ncbi:MAG TPA: amidohydrolase [Spirochaetes bacterium]|nr:amidohydrolase [Spirochaetota bacterium]
MKIFHGDIITCDKNNSVYKYLVEDKSSILFTGDELPEKYSRSKNKIELGEKALLPSFGDGHLHFSNWALIASAFFDVRDARNFEELGAMIRDFSEKDKKSTIVVAFGAGKYCVEEKRHITRQELDAFLPDRPIYIIGYEGHSSFINSKMLEMLPDSIKKTRGFNADSGHILHEAYYGATDFSTNTVPTLKIVKSITNGFDLLAAKGIGLIHTVEGIGFPKDLDVTLVSFIAKARAKKNLFNTRLFFQTMEVEKVIKRKLPRIGGCFATALDGCFGVCDAALNKPYSNDPDNKGILFYKDDEVINFAKKAGRAGLQIEFHVIGDAAVDQAVIAIEEALKDHPGEDHRHTLIHACLMSPENLDKCAQLGIGITLQPGFMTATLEPPEYLEEILGNRIKQCSPLRKIIDSGIHMSGGSDAPVTPPDPVEGIYGACNHPYDPGQSLSIQEALKLFTYEVARGAFDEKERGSLEKGKIADMVILNKNPLGVAPENLRELKIEQLYLSGRIYKPGIGLPGMLWNGFTGRKIKI